MNEELKRCPFCDGEPKLNDWRLGWTVECGSCKAWIPGERVPELESEEDEKNTDWDQIKQSAIDAWNKRIAQNEPVLLSDDEFFQAAQNFGFFIISRSEYQLFRAIEQAVLNKQNKV